MISAMIGQARAGQTQAGRSRVSTVCSAFVSGGCTMYPVLALLVLVGAVVAPNFATAINLINILEQVSVLGLTTIGLTFVVLIGRLDLSLEGIVGFAPMLAAVCLVPAAAARLFGLPVSVPVFALVAVLIGLVFKCHRYGRALYAIGGNEDAARAAGINVNRVIRLAFVFAGVLVGVLMTGRLDSAVTTKGQGIIFSVFAAAVIGGVGLVSGVLLIGVINNLLTLAQVPSFHVQASTGAVIIVAAVLTTVASCRSSGVRTRT